MSNLVKHGYDFANAYLVYYSEIKLTLESHREGEPRQMALALVELKNKVLALVYVVRGEDIRAISFRKASRKERTAYEQSREQG
jgi:uncharacterized DUF497 family protein